MVIGLCTRVSMGRFASPPECKPGRQGLVVVTTWICSDKLQLDSCRQSGVVELR